MKKIALIVLLAVVASRFIHDREVRPRAHKAVRDTPIHSVIFGDDEAQAWTSRAEPAPFDLPPPPPPAPPEPKAKGKRRGPRDVRPVAVAQAEPTPKVAPAWFPKSDADEETQARSTSAGVRVLLGQLSISPTRARTDLQKTVSHEVADWLAADVPMTWSPPPELLGRMILGSYIQPVARNVGPSQVERLATPSTTSAPQSSGELADLDDVYTLYRAGERLDFSDRRREQFVERYHHDVASGRMKHLGSIMAVVLAGLAAVSFYVRTDEATRGYYTNRLRVLALGSLAAAGFAAHRYWT